MLQREHSIILSTFIKPPFVIKIFVLSVFEWPFYTGFTVLDLRSVAYLTALLDNLYWVITVNVILHFMNEPGTQRAAK